MVIKKTLRPVRPNAGLEVAYRKKLRNLIDKMNRSVVWFLGACYKKNVSDVVEDALPSRALQKKLDEVMKRWRQEFNDDAEEIADWFCRQNYKHMSTATYTAFKSAGITVHVRMTRSEQDVLRSLIIENTNLIKSIPQNYLTEVQGLVQRSVQNGRDLGYLSDELEKRYQLTKKRSDMIARDQNNKATEQLSLAKHRALGITKGIWMHTAAGKTYRSTHVEMDGKEFNLSEGMYDSAVGYNVFPGSEINCYCMYRAVLPTLDEGE